MKPDKQLRKKYRTDYRDRTEFASIARLLQSIWREEKGYESGNYGNYLDLDFAKTTGANFLNQRIFEIVKTEVKNKHIDGKVIQEPRIWNNLLSSQSLAFNIFGELKLNKGLSTQVFKELYPKRKIEQIDSIEFEYSPGRKNNKYTGDSSAFDVFVEYTNGLNEKGFIGIEVKYAEDLKDEPSSHKEKYDIIAKKSDIFDLSQRDKLREKPLQQIWRDHLLALSLFVVNDDYKIGDFVYLYPFDNDSCKSAIDEYKLIFKADSDNYFQPLTLEKLVGAIKKYCSETWINDFENRYLKFDKIESASR